MTRALSNGDIDIGTLFLQRFPQTTPISESGPATPRLQYRKQPAA
jgi:hypothetical protein